MKKILVVSAYPHDLLLGCSGTLIKEIKNGSIVEILILILSKIDPEKLKKTTLKAFELLGVREVAFHDIHEKIGKFEFINTYERIKKYSIRIIRERIEEFFPDIVLTRNYHHGKSEHEAIFKAVLAACEFYTNLNIYSFVVPTILDLSYESLPFRMNVKLKNTSLQKFMEYYFNQIYQFKPIMTHLQYFIETPYPEELITIPSISRSSRSKTITPNIYINISDVIELKTESFDFYASNMGGCPHSKNVKLVRRFSNYWRWERKIELEYAEAFHVIRKIQNEL